MALIYDTITAHIQPSADISDTLNYPNKYPSPRYVVLKSKSVNRNVTAESILSAVKAIEPKYRKAVGNSVVEMNAPEKSTRDAEIILSIKDNMDRELNAGILKPVLAGLVSIINLRFPAANKVTISELRAAIRGKM